jgi:hypothetical protein
MPPKAIRRLLLNKPFQPFRLHVLESTAYDVLHPSMAFMGKAVITLHLPEVATLPAMWLRRVVIALLHVSRLELIGPAASSGNGQAGQGAPA